MKLGSDLTVVEGAKKFCEDLLKGIHQYRCITRYLKISRWIRNLRYCFGHVLEHVDNPVAVLKHVKQFLKKGGVM